MIEPGGHKSPSGLFLCHSAQGARHQGQFIHKVPASYDQVLFSPKVFGVMERTHAQSA